jgi:glutathione S-transferase
MIPRAIIEEPSMLKIHGIPRSRAFRCIWAAEEAGLPYEVIPIGFQPGFKLERAVEINPNNKIPALEDGALVLFESLAINLHIAGKAGAPLMPAGDDASRVLQWTLWAATEAEPHVMRWSYNAYLKPEADRVASEAAAGKEGARPAPRRARARTGAAPLPGRQRLHGGRPQCRLGALRLLAQRLRLRALPQGEGVARRLPDAPGGTQGAQAARRLIPTARGSWLVPGARMGAAATAASPARARHLRAAQGEYQRSKDWAAGMMPGAGADRDAGPRRPPATAR